MAEVKLTKNELRAQQVKLAQLERYLPTLQLKKAMLQTEVNYVRHEIKALAQEFTREKGVVEGYSALVYEMSTPTAEQVTAVEKVAKRYENIAGVDIPFFEGIAFEEVSYSLFDTPPWLDGVIDGLRKVVTAHAKVDVAEEKKAALEKELREVSIRVNLFEKIMIPRSRQNIRKIKVFLGDQELAAVSQAKVAKNKIGKKR
ncbi:V-type ATP synthase subunit D [Simkania negevensis]|uniref:V-type ATP synthase subunit D n=1 Tax=Simkania negevensis TaxID=83561 RepID=A0ABS3AV97_9BACT|nr:V-type ATP synthase subunit D [Simkania negevensis]